MKKTMIIILALILVLAFAAGCGNAIKSDANDNNGAAVVSGEENFRGSGSTSGLELGVNLGTIDKGNMSLDKINMFESDEEGSFRAGSGMDIGVMQKASGK